MEESVARQKAAVEKQVGPAQAGGFFTAGWSGPALIPPPAMAANCDPIGAGQSAPLLATAATAQQLDPALLRAIISQESGFRPCALSPKGAMGLMQLMPETVGQFHVADPFSAEQNINAGARYLKQLLDRFKGDLRLALAAYNVGPERVDGDPPAVPDIPETRDYVTQILKALKATPAENPTAKSEDK
jgi:soluble lytic murein transglycosylase-like protein